MAGNYRVPPGFDEGKPYESWKNEIEIWSRVTELAKKKQALAVVLALSGSARETAMEIPVDDLNKDDGMTTLIAKLDSMFLKEEKDQVYEAYSNFDRIKRDGGSSMADYIIEFEQRYSRIKKHKMELPDAVLAFKLLDTACLDVKDRQLALTACTDLTFASMKSALKRIFGGKSSAAPSMGIDLNQDAAFVTTAEQRRQKGKVWPQRDQQKTAAVAGTNPLDKFGRRSKCAVCQSTFHWAKDCPHKSEYVKLTEEDESNNDTVEECNITLFAKEPENGEPTAAEIFMTECCGSAIIDTACTRTVCGQGWLDGYISKLSKNELREMKRNEKLSRRPFKFGDGKVVYSTKSLKIPARIGQTKCQIETEVVPADVPLLLSKASMKRAGTVLDMEHDRAVMFNNPIKLEFTSSGHYCVNIMDNKSDKNIKKEDQVLTATEESTPADKQTEDEGQCEDEILIISENMSTATKKKMLLKLHKQFGHASVDRLQKLLRSSGNNDAECVLILQKIVSECEICQKYSRPTPKPAVGLPLASQHNETVAVDLHELEHGVWYLHIIDLFTRFSAGSILTTKKSSEIVKHFVHDWISVHGPPCKFFSDNGGEFNNDEVRDMAENFNIEIKSTAAYSPFSNGICERHNQTLTEIIKKVKASNNCDWSTAMDWALMAKNTMQNVHGYSPHQLVFGQNPNLPSVLTDKPPALEGTTKSEWVAQHITALHAARRAFTEAECSERIRRALRKQTRHTDENYESGDRVYYRRVDCPEWKGPGVVIGQDGAVIFVRHGGTCVRVHRLRLKKVNTGNTDPCVTQDDTNTEKIPDMANRDLEVIHGLRQTEPQLEPTQMAENDVVQNEPECSDDTHDGTEQRTGVHLKTGVTLKTGQIVKYKDRGVLYTAKVLGRAGKAMGKYKDWYNFLYLEPINVAGSTDAADMSKVDDFEVITNLCDDGFQTNDVPLTNVTDVCEDVFVTKDVSFDFAKHVEIKNWKDNNVFEEVKNEGQKCVSTRWVCTLKETLTGPVPKARLVARGFEELQVSDLQKDSPTCATESLRLLVALICQRQWTPHSMDIKSAFLQGMSLSRDVYIKPPPEAESEGTLWKLKKCVYGLADASLYWYNRVKEIVLATGGNISKVDPAIFYWLDEDCAVSGVLACHVDDFIWGGTQSFSSTVIPQLRSAFQVGREEHDNFCYVGIDFVTVNGKVQIHQENYIQNLQPIHISPSRAVELDSPLYEKERDELRSKIGQILWVARQSRPDVMFDASNLASSIKGATVQTIHEANRIVSKLKSKKVILNFQYLGRDSALKMVTFSDASFGNLSDGGTQGGHFIVLMGENGRFSPLSWQSRRVKRVVRSTLAGETLAMSEGIDNAIFLSTLFSELTAGDVIHPAPITCVTDNHSLADALKSTKSVTEKRLRLEISSIKELIHSKQVERILWYKTKEQLADCLTKKGASPLQLLKALGEGQWQLMDST